MTDFRYVLADMQPDETLAAYAARVKRERDELRAHVERLRQLGFELSERYPNSPWITGPFSKVFAETPAQSLAAVRADAVDSAVNYADDRNDGDVEQWGDLIEHYAQQLRNGSDDDE